MMKKIIFITLISCSLTFSQIQTPQASPSAKIEQIVGLTYNIFYLYFMSNTGFESVENIDSGQVDSFIKSISTTFTDSTGVQYSDLCYVEGS